jgi:hypothetical protein
MRVDRAIEKLRRQLERRGITSTAAALASAMFRQAAAAAPPGLAPAVVGSALASAGGAATGAIGFFPLMSTTQMASALAALAAVVTLGLALHQHARAGAAERAFAAADRELALSLDRLEQWKNQSRETAAESVRLEKASASLRAARISATPPNHEAGGQRRLAAGAMASGASPRADRSLLRSDPVARQAFADWFKALTELRFGPLFLTLGLSSEKINALEELMMQRDIYTSGTVLTLRPESVTPDQVTQSMRDLLGEEGFQQIASYGSTSLVRLVTDGLAGNLYNSPEPLSPEQADELTQILANSSPPGQAGRTPRPADINWDAVLPQAEGILSPAQFAVLKNEADLVSGGPGPFFGFHSVYPGSIGNTAQPPPSGLIIPAPKK